MRLNNKVSRSTAAVAMGIVVISTAAGCVDDAPDGEIYCVDRNTNQVIACDIEDRDSSGSSFFYWHSTSGYAPGHAVPADQRGSYFSRNDPAARQRYGLSSDPKTKVGGTKFTGGGAGSGSTGKSGSGGS